MTISRPILLLAGMALMPTLVPAQAPAVPEGPTDVGAAEAASPLDLSMDADEQFRALFAAGDYAAALPLAQQVVRLTELDKSQRHRLPMAYNNLGATQLQLSDLDGAEASYQRALDLVEVDDGISTKRLIAPLAGLGAVYAAKDQHLLAIEYLRRVIAVSRRADGLFNLSQLDIMEPLVAIYSASGDTASVLRERLFALQVVDKNFGVNDPRTLPAVTRLAELYESMSAHTYARAMYLRMREIALQEGGENNPILVAALLSIGRSHRMQFTSDPTSLLEPALYRDVNSGKLVPQMGLEPYQAPLPDREGRLAIEEALAILRRTTDPPPRLLAEALIELGNWNLARGQSEMAMPYYSEAWGIHAADLPLEPNPLSAPSPVFYRAPLAARRGPNAVPGKVVIRTARFNFTVDESGATRDIALESTDMSESQTSFIRRALARALYSPRFEDGKPAPTANVSFIGHWEELERGAATPPGRD